MFSRILLHFRWVLGLVGALASAPPAWAAAASATAQALAVPSVSATATARPVRTAAPRVARPAASLATTVASPAASSVVAPPEVLSGAVLPAASVEPEVEEEAVEPAAPVVTPPPRPPPVPTVAPAVSTTPVASAPMSSSSAATSAPLPPAGASKPVPVRVGDNEVFVLRLGTQADLARRGRLAEKVLQNAVEKAIVEVTVRREGSNVVVYVAAAPIAELSLADAEAAGMSSLEAYADQVAASVRQGLEAERRRGKIAKNVFSASLVVFLGLIAFFLLRKVSELAEWLRKWLESNTEALTVRVRQIEVLRPEMLQSGAIIGVGIARWFGQFGIVYLWLITVLSLFDSTRDYTEKLTGFVVAPVSQLMTRFATALPLVLVVCLGALAVTVLVRFVDLLFISVARRETTIAFVPADLAPATSVLLRFGIIVAAFVFAAPVITGDPDGAFARIGIVALVSFGLASTPLVATVLIGSAVLFGRRLKVGEHAEIAEVRGRLAAIDLMELRFDTGQGTEVRVPHLMLLKHPLRRLGTRPLVSMEIAVAAGVDCKSVERELLAAAGRVGDRPQVALLSADADGFLFRVTTHGSSLHERSLLTQAVVEQLASSGIALGRHSRLAADGVRQA